MPGAGRETGKAILYTPALVCRDEAYTLSLQGPKVLAKYVALYAAQLLTSGAALSALKLFLKFGTSANPQVGGQGAVVGGQGAVVGGQGAVVGGQGAAVGGQGAVVGGQGAAVGGQGAVVGGQGAVVQTRACLMLVCCSISELQHLPQVVCGRSVYAAGGRRIQDICGPQGHAAELGGQSGPLCRGQWPCSAGV